MLKIVAPKHVLNSVNGLGVSGFGIAAKVRQTTLLLLNRVRDMDDLEVIDWLARADAAGSESCVASRSASH